MGFELTNEKFPPQERGPAIDFLNENLKVSFEISPGALKHLPSISAENAKTGSERFGVLLGTKKVAHDGSIHIEIKGVYQETEEDVYGSYEEGIENVSYDLVLIKHRMGEIQRRHPEYRDFGFLGDVHTHPLSNIPKPSREDLLSVIRAYESKDLQTSEPYVFGIGAKHPSGEMEYWFYRLVKTDSKSRYGYKALENSDPILKD